MQSFDFKKYLPQFLIIVGFAVLSIMYSFPAFQGKVLDTHDNMSWEAMSHESRAYHDSTGVNALWTNSTFGGMPTYTISIPETNNWIGYLSAPIIKILAKPAYFLFLAMVSFFVLMSVVRAERWLAVIGAIAYAFSTYNIGIIVAGHETKMLAIAYLPGVLAGLILVFRGRWLSGALAITLFMALMSGTNHYQIMYYGVILFLVYGIASLIITIKEKRNLGKFFISAVIAIACGVIGIGPDMPYALTTLEYNKTTMRGGQSQLTLNHDQNKKTGGLDKDYAFMWSHAPGETFTLIIPYLYGGSSSEPVEKAPETEPYLQGSDRAPLYWGPQPFVSGPIYYGAIICFLFVLGMFVIRSPHKWWILGLSVLAMFMAMGDHFKSLNYFLFDTLPMFNKFRIPTMILVIPQLLFPMVGMWGLTEIVRGKVAGDDLWKKVRIAAGLTAGLCLLLAVGGSAFFDFINASGPEGKYPAEVVKALKDDRSALAMTSGLKSAFFILAAAGLLWAFAKNKVNRQMMIGGIGLLIVIDLFSVAVNYLNSDNYKDSSDYETTFQPRPVDLEISKDPDPYYRVLDLTTSPFQDAVQTYFHKSVGGYSPAKMEIYQDLIDVHMGGAIAQGKFNGSVLNMLNTKYIIFNGGPQQQAVFQPNPGALGNAWFVSEAKIAKTADEEMLSMRANAIGDTVRMPNAFDPARTAVIGQDFSNAVAGKSFGKDSGAFVKLTRYGLNTLKYASSNSQDGLAVFSDIWYPYGWEAYIDGKQAPILRANYVLRALMVPAGKHEIEFRFNPQSFRTGNTMALISSIIIVILVIAAIFVALKKNRNQGPPANVDEDPAI
jgi:hypothetical protein